MKKMSKIIDTHLHRILSERDEENEYWWLVILISCCLFIFAMIAICINYFQLHVKLEPTKTIKLYQEKNKPPNIKTNRVTIQGISNV